MSRTLAEPTERTTLPIVFLTVFIDLLGLGILIPVIPQLLGNPSSAFFLLPEHWSVRTGYVLLGVLVSVFPLMQFFATPILGELSDRYGRKPLLAISLAGTALSYVLFAWGILTRNVPLLFGARALDGITGGNIAVAQAAISDVTTPENRAKNFGLIGAAFGLGFIMGPYLGGKLSDPAVVRWFDAATPFWFAALLSLANVGFVVWAFPETLRRRRADGSLNWRKAAQNINRAWSLAPLRPLYVTSFLFQSGFTFFTAFFGVFLISRFGFSQGRIGDFFALMGLWITFTQAVVVRRVARRWREPAVIGFSLLAGALCMLAYLGASSAWMLFAIAPVFAIFNGLTQANLPGLVSRSVGPEIQGEILGINASVNALAQAMPPVLSGLLAGAVSPGAPLLVSGLFIGAAGLWFLARFRPVAPPVRPGSAG
jgi:DHA1 family tetracycline resistance protein-like MFS transporter